MLSFCKKRPKAIFAEVPICLCHQVMRNIPEKARIRYSACRNEYLMFCPSCGMRTHPDGNKQAVISEWYGINKPGDQHIQELWLFRYERQQSESLSATIWDHGLILRSENGSE